MIYDLHLHTRYSKDSNTRIKTILRRADELNIDGIAITDHGVVEGALKAQKISKNYDTEVIPGIEVTSNKGDILGLWIREKIDKKDPGEVIERIHELGGIAIAAHPFSSGILGRSSIGEKALDYNFDAFEAYNSRNFIWQNKKGLNFARKHGMNITAGSDAHFPEEIGLCLTHTDIGLKEAIMKGKTWVEVSRKKKFLGIKNLLRRGFGKIQRSF